MILQTVKNTDQYHYLVHWEKAWKKIVHKHVFNFFRAYNVIPNLQSGFIPGDSIANQVVDIYNIFSKVFDDGVEVLVVFL